jgi:flavin reductase (DIM6/NTAB) family NADH-FMN oxidoreductase RutF
MAAVSERLEISVAELPAGSVYPLLNSCVVPRPIAWVSTRSAAGVDNLAPHSYFTVSSVDPPVVQFTSVGEKDSLRNARETGEMVICFVPRPLADVVNLTATDFPPGVSEFDVAGLAREPAATVAPPRVAASPLALECRVVGERSFGRCTVVFGEVLHIAIAPDVVDEHGRPDVRKLAPAARLGSDLWGGLGEIWPLRRVPYAEWTRRHPSEEIS